MSLDLLGAPDHTTRDPPPRHIREPWIGSISLTVVEHELGHIAGLGDLDASVNDLMSGQLSTGIRRNASHQDAVDAALAS